MLVIRAYLLVKLRTCVFITMDTVVVTLILIGLCLCFSSELLERHFNEKFYSYLSI